MFLSISGGHSGVRHKVLVFYNISFFLFILGFLHWTVSDLFSCALFIA